MTRAAGCGGRRIGLLTGTFDPVHAGHIELAKAAMRLGSLDGVWLMVNAQPQHKAGVVAFADRLAMARLAVADEQGLAVYDGELARAPQVAATFAAMRREAADTEFVFVLGIDTLMRLDSWRDIESVVNDATYMTARRAGAGERELMELRGRLGVLGDKLRVQLFEFAPAAAASSAVIRAAVRAGERPEFLDVRVHDYLLRKQLYR